MEIKTSRHPLINTLIHTRLVRKPSSLREIEEFSRHILNRTAVLITEVWKLTAAEYSDFGNSCLKSRPEFWLYPISGEACAVCHRSLLSWQADPAD